MAKPDGDKIEYEFEDLRRNTDPVPRVVLAQLGFDEDETEDERHDGERRRDARRNADQDDPDADLHDEDEDGDETVTLTRRELSRRLTRTRQRAERAAQRKIEEAEDRAADAIGKLEKRIEGVESRSADSDYDEKIAALDKQLDEAMEDGDTKKVRELNRQVSELVAERAVKASQRGSGDRDTDDRDDQSRIVPRAREWLREQGWWNDPEYSHVRALAMKLDERLRKRGYSPEDEDFYEVLEKNIEDKYPGVITQTMRDDDEDENDDRDDDEFDIPRRGRRRASGRRERARRRGRSPVNDGGRGGTERGSEAGGRRRREKKLSRSQVANMVAFGLDPDNNEHVEEYLRNVK